MEFQLSYSKSWKMMLWKCCTQYVSKFGKLSSGHRTGKGQLSFQSQRQAMPKNAQTTAQLHSSHMQVKSTCMLSHFIVSSSLRPMDCSSPGSSVHGILQARILEWIAMLSSRESSQPRDWTWVSCVSCIAGGFLTTKPPGKPNMGLLLVFSH